MGRMTIIAISFLMLKTMEKYGEVQPEMLEVPWANECAYGAEEEGRHPAAKFLVSIVFYHPICCGSAMSMILSLHSNMFLNARGTFAVKNRCSAASILSRAN
jgi:hypothetical protein